MFSYVQLSFRDNSTVTFFLTYISVLQFEEYA